MEIEVNPEERYKGALAGKVVLLNAPPGAGKDTVANRIAELTGAVKGQFKDYLYVITAVMFNVPYKAFVELATDQETKEKPQSALGGISPRQALIGVSEKMVKPFFGKSYFGNIEAAKLVKRQETGVVYSDSGFIEEAHPLIQVAKEENVFIVKFTRSGHDSFENDSRDWLPNIDGVKVLLTANNKTVDDIAMRIIEFVMREGKPLN